MDDQRTARASDNVRASDRDREQVVERLQAAMHDGRLKMDEYVERMNLAYEAVTYGDLARLQDDLPLPPTTAVPTFQAPAFQPPAAMRPAANAFAALPTPLKVLWAIWSVPVLINVVIWVLVSASHGFPVYPWPLWVAGPSGAILFAITLIVKAATGNRQPQR